MRKYKLQNFPRISNEGLIQVIQIPIDYESNEYRLVNYLIKHIIGLLTMTTRKQEHFKISRIIQTWSKTYVKDEIKLQKRNPKEKEKYQTNHYLKN